MKSISISGTAFEVAEPYAEGHTVNAIEARVLNQTRAENIGNNFRKGVQAALALAEGPTRDAALAKVLADLQAYDAQYIFTSGGVSRTPDRKSVV